jgi:hypothetical protein
MERRQESAVPLKGNMFLFCNKEKRILKIIY